MIKINSFSSQTGKSKVEDLKKAFKEFDSILEESTDSSKLDNFISAVNETLNSSGSDTLSVNDKKLTEIVRNFLEQISAWILKNFSSVKLNSVIQLVSNLFSKLGYFPEIKKEEILKLLELETYDQLVSAEKKEKKNYEEILSNDSILTNQFLSAFYALIVTIANKPEIIIKSKNLLKSVITVMSQICEIDNIAIYYKKKRLISVFCKILKELKNAKEAHDSLITIAKLLMNLFSKIGMKRPIYRDYMFKKAVPDKVTDIFTVYFSKDSEMVKAFCIYSFFAIRTVDHKTYFWTKGVINNLIDILVDATSEEKISEKVDENLLEYVTLAIYNLSFDNVDIQSELKDLSYLEIAKQILMKYSKNKFLIFNILSTLRRIKDQEYVDKITEELLFTFFALFDYFYLTTKKEIEQDPEKINTLSNKFDFIILKELVAILGNIVKDEFHSKPFIDKNLHLVLIDLKLSFSAFPKLIKNTIGALINLTTSNEIRENISKVAAFIQSIYIILDRYKDNQAIVDYELKLIINVIKNDITVKTFISGDMFFYLLLFLKNFITNDEIIFNSVKIIRTLILKSKILILIIIINLEKGYDDFLQKLVEFYATLMGTDDTSNPKLFYKMLIEDLVLILETKLEVINVCIEVFLLLSYLANQNEDFKATLEKSDNFMKVMQKIINLYAVKILNFNFIL